mmetsp:Transcript_91087/g.241923  ORF Transcript_91087/g.241923 Transcript_91087/m.241923 type:complete len:406 (+) Transcript_91087:51-1268(+)
MCTPTKSASHLRSGDYGSSALTRGCQLLASAKASCRRRRTCSRTSRLCASLSFLRRFLSPGSQRWQNWQPRSFWQPSWNTKAQGLQAPHWCKAEPLLGSSAEPNTKAGLSPLPPGVVVEATVEPSEALQSAEPEEEPVHPMPINGDVPMEEAGCHGSQKVRSGVAGQVTSATTSARCNVASTGPSGCEWACSPCLRPCPPSMWSRPAMSASKRLHKGLPKRPQARGLQGRSRGTATSSLPLDFLLGGLDFTLRSSKNGSSEGDRCGLASRKVLRTNSGAGRPLGPVGSFRRCCPRASAASNIGICGCRSACSKPSAALGAQKSWMLPRAKGVAATPQLPPTCCRGTARPEGAGCLAGSFRSSICLATPPRRGFGPAALVFGDVLRIGGDAADWNCTGIWGRSSPM